MGRSDWDEIRLVVKWFESGWWEPSGRLVYQHLDLNTPGKCSHSTKAHSLPSSPLYTFSPGWSHLSSPIFSTMSSSSVIPRSLSFITALISLLSSKLYPQLLLDNPSQSTIDTSHSTNIIWTYHSPLATPKETLILLLVNGITIYSVSQATNWRVKDNSFLHSPHSPTQ